ncbi:MAG TPA: amino acid ABC transporter permease [Candidatus Sulfotelmatobacter sp.]|jgi:polar amino acid transport system permease protein|nr:amino acid ABC transporter permease [Candidatus Sulfotelmatobacter sp.]
MLFDAGVILNNLDYLLWGRLGQGEPGGLLLTVLISLISGIASLALGVPMGLLAWSNPGLTRRLLFWWADLIRGIPLIFVIFWVYFLVPALLGGDVPGAMSVILALAWFTSAAVMHSTVAGLEALPKGQSEAALASGMSRLQTLRWVLLPQALRNLTPSFVGLFASLIKDTSLAFILNVPELTMVASQVNNRTQLYPAEIFLFTAALYFVLCGGLSWFGRRLTANRTA